MVLKRSKLSVQEKVDGALIAEEFAVGLARSPQIDGRLFIGVTFKGFDSPEHPYEEVRGDVVLTLELAEALAGLLDEAVAKARRQAQAAGGSDSNALPQ